MPKGNPGVPKKSFIERLARLTRVMPNGCVEWTGKIQTRIDGSEGYGRVCVMRGANVRGDKYAHRWVFEHFRGAIPQGLDVCHSCDNRRCVNPAHLFVGTRAENLRDAARKGRMGKKLSVSDVHEIRRRLSSGETQTAIGRSYGVAHSTVGAIKRGEVWHYIDEAVA